MKLITVYDVVWKEYRNTMKFKAKVAKVPFFNRSVKRADKILCISHYTKHKVEDYFPNRRCKDIEVGISCNSAFLKRDVSIERRDQVLIEYGLSDKFLLFVGTLEPRKNLSFLLKLMPEIYKRTGVKLLVVGAKGWKNDDIHLLVEGDPLIQKSVVFSNYVETDCLIDLYNIATCYVSTSLNEGFGLPQLEAMKCGCPVVSPHNSAMIEVVEGRGVSIEGWDTEIWTNEIVRIVKDDNYRHSLCNPNTSEYEWENIVKRFAKYINIR